MHVGQMLQRHEKCPRRWDLLPGTKPCLKPGSMCSREAENQRTGPAQPVVLSPRRFVTRRAHILYSDV